MIVRAKCLDDVDRCAHCGDTDTSGLMGHGHYICPECNQLMMDEMYEDEITDPVDEHSPEATRG